MHTRIGGLEQRGLGLKVVVGETFVCCYFVFLEPDKNFGVAFFDRVESYFLSKLAVVFYLRSSICGNRNDRCFRENQQAVALRNACTDELTKAGLLVLGTETWCDGTEALKWGLEMTLSRGSSQRDRARERQHRTRIPSLGDGQQNGLTFHPNSGGSSRGPIEHTNGQGHLASSGRTGLEQGLVRDSVPPTLCLASM